ncbi:MAG: LemA family protein [Steroidobacteraceae bacterium]
MSWIPLIAIIVLVVWVVGVYNRLIAGRNTFKNAFAQIDVQLTRRYELIPNLVEVAKGYLKHERETLEAVIKARNAAVTDLKAAAADPGSAAAMQQLSGAEAQLGGVLGRLFALAEAYPDLKANQTMMQLSEELTSTENKVAFARQAFNDSVLTYNNLREQFPGNIVAGMFSFQPAQLLEVASPECVKRPRSASPEAAGARRRHGFLRPASRRTPQFARMARGIRRRGAAGRRGVDVDRAAAGTCAERHPGCPRGGRPGALCPDRRDAGARLEDRAVLAAGDRRRQCMARPGLA